MKKILNIYKPKGPTSFDIVSQIKKKYKGEKVGHAGTLDPLAEGVLVVAVGRQATRKLKYILAEDKEYIAEIKFGYYSETDDEEGKKTKVVVTTEPTKQQVENVLEKFIGNIVQTSPVYSAVKIQGERAYKKARRGESFVSPPRIVTIKEIEILNYTFPILKIRVVVGSGTYIRSLAREIGESLQTGAYLTTLIRTRVGMYIVAEAKKI